MFSVGNRLVSKVTFIGNDVFVNKK